jgi:hypothetical protein
MFTPKKIKIILIFTPQKTSFFFSFSFLAKPAFINDHHLSYITNFFIFLILDNGTLGHMDLKISDFYFEFF